MSRLRELLTKHRELVLASLLTNLALLGVVVIVVGGLVLFNQGDIFNYFASHYLREQNSASLTAESWGANLLTEESRIVEIVDRASPAVVSVVVTKDVPIIERYYEEYSPQGGFFGPDSNVLIPRLRERGVEERQVGGGSGFIVSPQGLVITNRHVVEDETASYSVLTNDGESYDVDVIARDEVADIAVLKIKAPGERFPYLAFDDSDRLKPGQTVVAIGNALGEFRNSISVGVVSGLSRSVAAGDGRGRTELLEEVIQTDAAINPGNSGGPLLNNQGRVIGVNVAVALGSENIGFALPANIAHSIVLSVERYGEIVRPYIGVRYVQVTPQLKEDQDLLVEYGALVSAGSGESQSAVVPGSPAARAGLTDGDIILAVDGVKLSGRTLSSVIRNKEIGQTVKLDIMRGNEEREVELTLDRAPSALE